LPLWKSFPEEGKLRKVVFRQVNKMANWMLSRRADKLITAGDLITMIILYLLYLLSVRFLPFHWFFLLFCWTYFLWPKATICWRFLRLPSGVKLTGRRKWLGPERWKHLLATRILFYAVLIFPFRFRSFLPFSVVVRLH